MGLAVPKSAVVKLMHRVKVSSKGEGGAPSPDVVVGLARHSKIEGVLEARWGDLLLTPPPNHYDQAAATGIIKLPAASTSVP